MSELVFDPIDHSYLHGGRRLASVTRILRAVGLYSDYSFATKEHRLRGQAVHRACHLIDIGQWDPERTHTEIIGYAYAYQKLAAEAGWNIYPAMVTGGQIANILVTNQADNPYHVGNMFLAGGTFYYLETSPAGDWTGRISSLLNED